MHALHGNTRKRTTTDGNDGPTTKTTKTTTPTTVTQATTTTSRTKSILDPIPTKPTPKAKAKAKEGPGRPRSAAAKSAALKTAPKPRASKLSDADVDKPAAKATATRASGPKKTRVQTLPGATFAMNEALEQASNVDDPAQTLMQYLGARAVKGEQPYASAMQLLADLVDITQGHAGTRQEIS